MEGYYTIGELAQIYPVSVHALRFYDKKGVFQPAIKNEATGYRYYAPEQLYQLELIIMLRDLDIPIQTVAACVEQVSSRAQLRDYLTARREEIEEQIRALEKQREALLDVDGKFENLLPVTGVVRLSWMPSRVFCPMDAVGLPAEGPDRKFFFRRIVSENGQNRGRQRLDPNQKPGLRSLGAVSFRSNYRATGRIQYSYIYFEHEELDVPEGGATPVFIDAGTYVTYRFCSEPGERTRAYQVLEAYLEQNHLNTKDLFIEMSIGTGLPPVSPKDEITELQIKLL